MEELEQHQKSMAKMVKAANKLQKQNQEGNTEPESQNMEESDSSGEEHVPTFTPELMKL